MSLYQDLEYNWERGFYSVVHSKKDGLYQIFSTKDFYGDLRMSDGYETVEEAKKNIGERTGYTKEEFKEYFTSDWEIVDTIHPSELMGKGFQVGDRVKVTHGKYIDSEGEVMQVNQEGKSYAIKIDEHDQCGWPWVFQNEIKPVLPQNSTTEVQQGNSFCKPCACCKSINSQQDSQQEPSTGGGNKSEEEKPIMADSPQLESKKKECEHNFVKATFADRYKPFRLLTLFCCTKCGLVTCKKPNE